MLLSPHRKLHTGSCHPNHSLPSASGHHEPICYLHAFPYSRHFLWMESSNRWPFVSDFPRRNMIKVPPHFRMYSNLIPFHYQVIFHDRPLLCLVPAFIIWWTSRIFFFGLFVIITNNASVSLGVPVFVWMYVFIPPTSIYSGEGTLDRGQRHVYCFEGGANCFLKEMRHFTFIRNLHLPFRNLPGEHQYSNSEFYCLEYLTT